MKHKEKEKNEMINTITLVGNLTSDPVLRFTQSGIPVANVTVARTPKRRDPQTDELIEGEPMFLRCIVWDGAAENVAESLTKGDRVIVTGSLRSHSWDTPKGERRTDLEMKVDEIGPTLRWAVARPERVASNSGGRKTKTSQEPAQR